MGMDMRKFKTVLAASIAVLCLVGITVGSVFIVYSNQPAGRTKAEITVTIDPGMSLTQVAHLLAERKVIANPTTFRLYTYLKGQQRGIQAGEYLLSPSQKPAQILQKLVRGETVAHMVTIPEGYRILEIAELLATAGLANVNRFLKATEDPELLKQLDIPTGSLEGYLFPDTYKFSLQTGEKEIVRTLVANFKKRILQPRYVDRAKKLGMSFHEVVTLASLIEKETGLEKERPKIAAVFHNRLQRKMKLQTDPTVIYALADFDGNIRKKDLSVDSPYNTYRYAGLPPGPIASPGEDSIAAALFPDESDALYFVSRQDGSHQFSTNLEDHNRAVMKYQIKPANG